ncbi:hypothetical protein [Chryseobacterium lactis]|uniref:hypothetical protein n=1 Tax=Chryseobacterium lactis TaxID=1241981 RepID=UPI0016295A48|nr:hypothetical protein [Chryseobacterium lactis]
MKKVLKIALTNWVNILTVYIFMFGWLFITELVPGIATLKDALYNTFGSLMVYYLPFWLGFSMLIALLDFLFFSIDKKPQYTNYKLFFEWLLISLPFVYWLIKYDQWIFLVAILAFSIGQYLRRPYIFKIL